MRRFLALLAVLALLAAACGADDPVVAGLCPQDEPDCDDVGAIPGDEAPDTSDSDEPITQSGGALAGGGLSVPEAMASDATGIIAVSGFLFDDGSGIRLCEALAESFPPQCGGSYLLVDGLSFDDVGNLPEAENIMVSTEQNVTWTDGFVSLLGDVDGDRFTVSTTSN